MAGASAAHAAVLVQVFMYYKSCPDDNEYAHPMDLCPVVDLHAGKVIHIDAYPQPPAIPMRGANYHRCGRGAISGLRCEVDWCVLCSEAA